LRLPPDAPAGLLAAPFVWDDNAHAQHQDTGTPLVPGEWQTINWNIPPLTNALLSRAGLSFRTTGTPWSGSMLLDWLDWDGVPEWSCDFSSERPEYDAISGWTFVRGFWRLDNRAYHGSGVGMNESYTGDSQWSDLHLAVDLVPLVGDQHHVLLRVQGTRRSYVVGLAESHRVVLYKNAGGYHEVASAELAWAHGTCVRLEVTAQGAALTVAADRQVLLRWHDEDAPYLKGQIGLGNGVGCHTRFRCVAVRGLANDA
jgi:hypothetical protein